MSADATAPLDCIIIGAGFGGIAMARALSAQGGQRFVMLEKADAPGGTWRENTYPGAACDVPSHLYSLSDAPNPHWSRLFPSQPEIHAYLRRLAEPFEASGQLRYGTRMLAARWLPDRALWQVDTAGGEQWFGRDLVMAPGGLHHPAWPDLPSLETFRGRLLHTARWPESIDLGGLRVGVIGTGASAIQVIPEIAAKVTELHVAVRTPPWVLPRPGWSIPGWLRAGFARFAPLRLAFRAGVFLLLEALAHGLVHPRTAFWARWLGHRLRRRQIADPALQAALRPDYPVGCKRVLFSSDFYPALCRPNTQLHRTAITSIEPDGWRLADGQRVTLDAIVCATGFQPLRLREDVEIVGRDARRLSDAWATRPSAHLGMGVAGFPNLFFLLGPNTALGHNSVLYMIESQVRHIQALRALRRARGLRCVEPTEAAQQAFIDQLDRRFRGTAWDGGCTSWYLDDSGHNIALWVGSALGYRWRTRRPRIEEYRFAE